MPGSGLLRWAEVDAARLRHNAAAVRRRLAPSVRLLAMVKSEGYGHGAAVAARAALDGGADWLGVYTPDEALALRDAGFPARLLVAGWSPPATLQALLAHDVDVAVWDAGDLDAVVRASQTAGTRARVHLKIDTGLNRLGAAHRDAAALGAAAAAARDRVEVAGIFTHFADAEADPAFTAEQHARFLAAVEQLRPAAPDALLHACGTAGILRAPEAHHDMVRLGIGLYGYGGEGASPAVDLHPGMSLFARVAQVKTVDAGDTVGYGRTWRAEHPTRVATVAIGYGQGVPRALSNRGAMVVRGTRCPLVGIVNMDQVTLDVTGVDGVAAGDAVLVFGDTAERASGPTRSRATPAPSRTRCCVASPPPFRAWCGTAPQGRVTIPRLRYREAMSRVVRVAAAQYQPRVGDLRHNREEAVRWASRAMEQGAQLVVLPELASSGYVFADESDAAANAERVAGGPMARALHEVCALRGAYIVAGVNEQGEGCRYNSAVVVGPDGVIATYHKLHLFHDEQSWFAPGGELSLIDLPFGKVGIIVCFDLWFPEPARALALAGAEIIAVPTNWVASFKSTVWDDRGYCQGDYVAMATAAQNGVVMVCADRIGVERGTTFLGASIIVGTDGWPLAGPAAKDKPALLIKDVDLDEVEKARRRTPRNHLHGDRRPDAYRVVPAGARALSSPSGA